MGQAEELITTLGIEHIMMDIIVVTEEGFKIGQVEVLLMIDPITKDKL